MVDPIASISIANSAVVSRFPNKRLKSVLSEDGRKVGLERETRDQYRSNKNNIKPKKSPHPGGPTTK